MLKVFLVEDESVVREALRDSIPWQEYGYTFAGEAADGEMALGLIRRSVPDVVITDIKMPFMDGLSLSHMIKKEFPSTRIIIMSGYDDFEYARRAISEGVDQYLLKPVTRQDMHRALDECRLKIEAEREQQVFADRYRQENLEYEHLQLRNYLEKVFAGTMSVEEIYGEAARLSLDVSASCFSLILFSAGGQDSTGEEGRKQKETLQVQDVIRQLTDFFYRYPQYIFSKWGVSSYCIIVKGSAISVPEDTIAAVRTIEQVCRAQGDGLAWYVAQSQSVERFSALRECFQEANHIFTCRFWLPDQHILTARMADRYFSDPGQDTVSNLDAAKVDPQIIGNFLQNGRESEVGEFTQGYLGTLKDVLGSRMFRGYLLLSIRFHVLSYIQELGLTQKDFLDRLAEKPEELAADPERIASYLERLITLALRCRDRQQNDSSKGVLDQAMAYIDEHYTEESLSLNTAAQAVGVSSSYLSTLFSRSADLTFVEYVTRKRMEKARELLRGEHLSSAQIAQKVGYKDPHYFSFVFRKTQGCSPREYRAGDRKDL